jgi:UDP-glucose 4-epimerase
LSKVLITGGAGFLGGAVAKSLAARSHQVLVFDNLSQGHLEALPHGTPAVVGDLQDFFALENLFAQHEFDVVVHLAALTGADVSLTQPLRHYRENVTGLLNLLLAMRIARVDRLVFCSDAHVYGLPESSPVSLTTPVKPVSPYGWSKAFGEQIVSDARAAHSMQSITFRLFGIAGATELCGESHTPETHLIPRVLDATLGKLPAVEVYGTDHPTPDGTAVRDLLHVVDAAQAFTAAVEKIDHVSGTFNLGAGSGCSVREILACAERIVGRKVPVSELPRRPAYAPSIIADIELTVAKLGWEPRHSLKDIISSAWSWRQRNPAGYKPAA